MGVKRRTRDLYVRQGGLCYYCLYPMTLDLHRPTSITRDHMIPRARKDECEYASIHSSFNILGACAACNNKKGAMTHFEFQWWIFDNPQWLEECRQLRIKRGIAVPEPAERQFLTPPSLPFQAREWKRPDRPLAQRA